MIGPMYSEGVSTVTLTYGSWIAMTLFESGIADGLSTTSTAPVVELDAVLHVGRGGDERQVVLTLQALAHDLHVQEPEEPAAEPEAERARRLGVVRERRVVEAQLLERLAQVGVLVAVDGIEPAEHHRLRVAVALERWARDAPRW